MKQILALTRKELAAYFGSPMALLFVGVFLAVALFAFFWGAAFFERGIADVRPLFQWMPVLMIFLVASLTMRQWSEEQRSGTLEVLLTLPVSKLRLVLGKFLAVMALVAIALALTLFLPITVAVVGQLDWGPVIGGYLAALLMAAAYAAIGLLMSSRTDNQIVALILTVVVCGLFYAIGAATVTGLAGGRAADVLQALSTGSRFESIERGVIDLRDLVYYLSLCAIFLVLTTLSLDSKRWSSGQRTEAYRRSSLLTSALLVANLVLLNVWIFPLNRLRLDLTAEREYSLSSTTRNLLTGLAEPLTIRAYVSDKTHPLLAPIRPRLEDLLREYEIAGAGKVIADQIDPATDSDMELEANQIYGIQPTAFQVSERYEASVINAYFDVLVRYGDQSEVLNFGDLIEVDQGRDGAAEVRFRNLEYDLTRAIKKAVYGYQSVDTLLASLSEPVTLTLHVTYDTLPQGLADVPEVIRKVAQELADKSGGKLAFESVDPDASGAEVTREQLLEKYKLRPITASLFSDESYYLDLVLQQGSGEDSAWQLVTPSGEISEASVRTAIESALKRTSTGYLTVVGLWTPSEAATVDMYGQSQSALRTWQLVREQLSRDYSVQTVDLSGGQAPQDVDVLIVISPQDLDDKARYAIDQFLMRGGAVVFGAGNYRMQYDQYAGDIALEPVVNGVRDMLEHYGIGIENALVMDPQNEPFPVQTQREVAGMVVSEWQALDYPFFVDIRADGMDKSSPIVGQIAAVTLNWASPLTVDEAKNRDRAVTALLKSSPRSWLRTDTNIRPDLVQHPETGFAVEGESGSQTLAVAVRGVFDSYFKDKASPLASSAAAEGADDGAPTPTPAPQAGGFIESSPETARLVVVGSADFLTDIVFQISNSMSPERYLNSLQFLQNAVDWSVEDLDLLEIRSHGQASRVLAPMSEGRMRFWEILNYGVALAALATIGVVWNVRRRNEKPMPLAVD